jgi:hypothetical protein
MAIIYSTGFQQSISNDSTNSKPVINVIEWDTNYKKNKGTMNVNINKNGKKNKYQIDLNKNELENLLKMPAVNQSLDQRLTNDFPILETSIPRQNILNKSKSKSKTNYDELEDLFALRKKLMSPYHLTHRSIINKTRRANGLAKQRKVNNKKKSRKNNNKAKGVTKFFNRFF